MQRTVWTIGCTLAAACCAQAQPTSTSSGQASGQVYPSKPIRLVVPFPAGGPTDITARIISPKIAEALGQNVLIDNRGGGSSIIGSDMVAKSPPDGYTLLLTATPFVIGAGLYKKLPYDPLKDFAPVMQIGSAPNVLVVHPSLPAKTVRDLIALARAQPEKIDFASSGNGSAQHLFMAMFVAMAGIKMTHIP